MDVDAIMAVGEEVAPRRGVQAARGGMYAVLEWRRLWDRQPGLEWEQASVEAQSSWHDWLSLTHRWVDQAEEVAELNQIVVNRLGIERI